MRRLRAPTKRAIRLPALHANAGLIADFQSRLRKAVEMMNRSLLWHLRAQYRERAPEIAQDASPASELEREMRRLGQQWERNFAALAAHVGKHFAEATSKQTDSAFRQMLKRQGFTVEFKMTREQNDIVRASVAENVNLIKSIAPQHLTQVRGIVMRGVQAGRDVGGVVKELEDQFGVAERRAETIARQQVESATATLTRARQMELGLNKAQWLHSGGGKHPRPTHVANSGKVYDVRTGWFDPHEKKYILPGQLINCRCVSCSLIPGLDEEGE